MTLTFKLLASSVVIPPRFRVGDLVSVVSRLPDSFFKGKVGCIVETATNVAGSPVYSVWFSAGDTSRVFALPPGLRGSTYLFEERELAPADP